MAPGFIRLTSLPVTTGHKKASYHVRSASLPCRSHPLISNLEEQIRATRSWAANPEGSSAWIEAGLSHIEQLQLALEDFLQLSQTQETLRQATSVDQFLDGLLQFVDAYGSFVSTILTLKECHSNFQSAFRRRDEVGIIGKMRSASRKAISQAIPPQAIPTQAFARKAAPRKRTPNGDWQEIKRKQRFPSNWRFSDSQENMVKPYVPYDRRTTYAQAVHPTSNQSSPHSSPHTRPTSPVTPKGTYYYVSPHSPTELRFPPSSQYPEWRGRCFKCCRSGHSIANCRSQRRCGKCWAFGHIGSNCDKMDRSGTNKAPFVANKGEPGFEELLADPRPYLPPLMPEGRPPRVHCYIERDEDYFLELEALSKSVVVHNLGFQGDLSVDKIADYAVTTGLVQKSEIQVSELPGSKFLIRLPPRVDAPTFIRATPAEAWDDGLSFQQWTPLEEAAIVVPRFKILLELIGVPTILWREIQVVKAVSQFGVYLGSLEQENPNNIKSWLVAIGTDDLAKIPQSIAMHVGGMEFPVLVRPITWKRSVLYRAEDFPPRPDKFKGPSYEAAISNMFVRKEDEFITMRKAVLRDICKGKSPNELPPECRQFAAEPGQAQRRRQGHREHPEMVEKNKGKGVAGQQLSPTILATRRQHVQVHSQRKLSFQEGSSSNQENSNDTRIGCTPGMHIDPVPQRETDQIEANVVLTHEGDNSIHMESQQGVVLMETISKIAGTQSPKLMQRGDSKNVSNTVGGQSSQQIMRHSKEVSFNGALNAPMQKGNTTLQQPPNMLVLNSNSDGANKEAALSKATNCEVSQNSSTAVTLRELKFSAKKNKNSKDQKAGPSSRPAQKFKRISVGSTLKPLKSVGQKKRVPLPLNNRPPKRAQIHLNSEGFFEVRVNSDHMSNLANGCGFKVAEVQALIDVDNSKRIEAQKCKEKEKADAEANIEHELDSEMEEALSRFELDPTDDEVLAQFDEEEAHLADEN